MTVKQGFRTSEVAKLTGLSQRQLDHWDRTGFVKPSLAPAGGRGSARFYSFRDLVRLRVAKELRAAGVSLQALRKIVDRLEDQLGLEDPLAEARLVVSGDDLLLVRSGDELVSVLKSPGQGVLQIVLDLPKVVEEINEKVARLSRGTSPGLLRATRGSCLEGGRGLNVSSFFQR